MISVLLSIKNVADQVLIYPDPDPDQNPSPGNAKNGFDRPKTGSGFDTRKNIPDPTKAESATLKKISSIFYHFDVEL